MAETVYKCEPCGIVLERGYSFCPGCGNDVSKLLAVRRDMGEAADKRPDHGISVVAPKDGDETEEPLKESVSAPDSEDSNRSHRPSFGTQCMDLDILCNEGRIFIEESILPFEFRVRPKLDGITDLCIEIEALDVARVREELDEYLIMNQETETFVSVKPPRGCHGLVPFSIYVGYMKGHEEHWYKAQTKRKIYKADQPAGKVLDNLRIELHANIDKGNASDGIQQRLDGLHGLLKNNNDPAAELQRVELTPDWKPLMLSRCRAQRKLKHQLRGISLPDPPPSARTSRITLLGRNGCRLNILSRPALQLGKNRSCDIVTRNMTAAGDAGHEENSRISRFHCRIENRGVDCLLIDAGRDNVTQRTKPSSYGTFLDGKRLSPGLSDSLPMNRHFKISLAETAGEGGAFVLNGYIGTCSMAGLCMKNLHDNCLPSEPAFMVLRRYDNLPEAFVVVWKFAPLHVLAGILDPDTSSLCLFRDRGGFACSINHSSSAHWCVPGATAGGFSVVDYRQFGKWAEKESTFPPY